jgi:hypothetical protein
MRSEIADQVVQHLFLEYRKLPLDQGLSERRIPLSVHRLPLEHGDHVEPIECPDIFISPEAPWCDALVQGPADLIEVCSR